MAAACGPSAPQKRYSMPKPRQTGRPANLIQAGPVQPLRPSIWPGCAARSPSAGPALPVPGPPAPAPAPVRPAHNAPRRRVAPGAAAPTDPPAGACVAPSAPSLPKPRICTEMIDGCDWRAVRERLASLSAEAAAAPDAALAELSAEVLTAAVTGTPLLLPWAWMLAALTTCSAAVDVARAAHAGLARIDRAQRRDQVHVAARHFRNRIQRGDARAPPASAAPSPLAQGIVVAARRV